MTDLCELPIGEQGKIYIRSVFNNILGVCAETLTSIAQQGSCYAVLPRGTSLNRALRFESGGLVAAEISANWIAERIAHHAKRGKRGIVLIQDLWAKPRDHMKHPPHADWWIHKDEVYVWAEFGGPHAPAVSELLREPRSFDFAIFLADGPELAASLRAGEGNVDEIAADVIEIYVPAYDQESFVMWTR